MLIFDLNWIFSNWKPKSLIFEMGVSIDSWCIQSVNLDTVAETKSLGGKCICVWPKNCIQWDHFDTVINQYWLIVKSVLSIKSILHLKCARKFCGI
jgi:hypothetical protein